VNNARSKLQMLHFLTEKKNIFSRNSLSRFTVVRGIEEISKNIGGSLKVKTPIFSGFL
jgi:hypothetical protein